CAGRPAHSIELDIIRRDIDPDKSAIEDLEQLIGCPRIPLVLWDDKPVRCLLAGATSRVDPCIVPQPLPAIPGEMLEERSRRNQVIFDDVLDGPFAALPRERLVPAAHRRIVPMLV